MVDAVAVPVSMTDDCPGETDFWRSVDERLSSTVAGFGFSFEGVLGLDRFAESVDRSSSLMVSRWLLLDLEVCE